MTSLKQVCIQLIQAGNLKDVIDLLLHHLPQESEWRNTAVLLSARLANNGGAEKEGTISESDRQLEQNRIRKALLDIANAIPEHQQIELNRREELELQNAGLKKQNRRYRWLVGAGVYLLIAGSVAWWLLGQQSSFRIEADLLVDQMTFTYENGTSFLPETSLDRVGIQYFSEVSLPAEEVVIGSDHLPAPADGAVLKIRPMDIPGADPELRMYHVGLDKIKPSRGSEVLLQRPSEKNLTSFLMQVRKEEASLFSLSYQDSVRIEGDYLELSSFPGVESFIDPGELTALFPNSGKEIQVKGIPHQSILAFKHNEPVLLSASDLEVSDLRLNKDQDNKLISSVLRGEIWLVESDEENAMEPVIKVSSPDQLAILADEPLAITSLQFSEEGIRFFLEGTVTDVQTGLKFTSRSPVRWEWLWHNKKSTLIVIGLVMLGLLFFIPLTWLNRIKAVKDVVK